MRENTSSSSTVSKFNIFETQKADLETFSSGSILIVIFFPFSSTVGPGGPGAQRLSPAVCVREAEGAAGHDGGPGLRGPDGDGGHRACQAAPGVPPRPLNHNPSLPYTNIFA